jgi:uncharacterized protein DUF2867
MNVQQMAELQPILAGADHMDVKTVEGAVTLREFVAKMMAFQPVWLTFLYAVRGVFVLFLGMRQRVQPVSWRLKPEEVPMTSGQKALFFTVRDAAEDHYWIAEVKDRHLDAALSVIAEKIDEQKSRFYVMTTVHYNDWSGPVYFNVIRPFHHLVVGSMARAGVKASA